jgi:hypothetical protein
MAEVEFPKRVPAPHQLARRPIPDDYRPKQLSMDHVERKEAAPPATEEFRAPIGKAVPERSVNLRKLEAELGRQPLEEIASLVRSLTYGEMIELAASMWKAQPDESGLTQENLPAVLYRWSTARPV